MQKIRLYIIRHGNTFLPEQTPLRVGARTDLPLVASGFKQALDLGVYFRSTNIVPDVIYSSPLKRATETAQTIKEAGEFQNAQIAIEDRLNEIDHGIDEGRPEHEVEERLGVDTLEQWNKNAVMPEQWSPRPEQIVKEWRQLLDEIYESHIKAINNSATTDKDNIIFLVTSNGRARFVPLLPNVITSDNVTAINSLKLRTGSFGMLLCNKPTQANVSSKYAPWQVELWNVRP
jgi:probable phosphoglycerate mutase